MMGMTGTMIGAGDALAWNLADIHCHSADFDRLFEQLTACETDHDIQTLLAKFHQPAPLGYFAEQEALIEDIFLQDTIHDILQAASAHKQAGEHADWSEQLLHRCPYQLLAFAYDDKEAALKR